MKGRTPTPTALKLLTGNPGKRPLDLAHEPSPIVGLGEAPEYLRGDAEALKYWMSQGPELVKIKTLTEADGAHFANLCLLHSRIVNLTGGINTLREKEKLRGKLSEKEENKLMTKESQRMKTMGSFQKIAAEFGMGAASRTRIKVTDGQGEFSFGKTESAFDRVVGLAR